MAENNKGGGALKSLLSELPFDKLKDDVRAGASTLGERAVGAAGDRLNGLTDKLTDVADGGGITGMLQRRRPRKPRRADPPSRAP